MDNRKNLPLRSRTMREIAVCVPIEQVARKSAANDAIGKGIRMEAVFATAAPSSPTFIMMLQSVSVQCVHALARCQWHHWQKIADSLILWSIAWLVIAPCQVLRFAEPEDLKVESKWQPVPGSKELTKSWDLHKSLDIRGIDPKLRTSMKIVDKEVGSALEIPNKR